MRHVIIVFLFLTSVGLSRPASEVASSDPQPKIAAVTRKDGSVFWISVDGHAVRDETGAVLYYEGTNRDVTERVLAREALARNREELERIVHERTAQLEAVNESLRNEMADRQRLERQVFESVEREQERIGQDLHDGLCQLLAGIKFKVASLRNELEQQGRRL